MAEDIASLGLKVDSQGVAAGATALDALAASADRAEGAALGATSAADALAQASRDVQGASSGAATAMERAGAASRDAQKSTSGAAAALDRSGAAVRRNTEATEQLGAASKATGAAIQGEAAAIGSARQAFDAHIEQYRTLQRIRSADTLPGASGFVGPLKQQTAALNAAGLSAKQYAQQMRLLPAQITDVVTSLASGSPAYLVAIQQGGQLRDGFGGIANAGKAVLSILTPMRLALIGGAGAAAALATAFVQGQAESFGFEKALILSGNAAGETAAGMAAAAESIDDIAGTQRQAAAVLTQLAASGKVAADQLEGTALAAIQLQRSAGVAAEQTAKAFIALGEKPAEASRKLNEQYHYLTASVYAQIRALEDEGRTAEAAALAQQTFQTAIQERAKETEVRLGTLQKLARGTGAVFSEMWDAVLNVGRDADTPLQQLEEIESKLRRIASGELKADPRAKRKLEVQRDRLQADPNIQAQRTTAENQRKEAESNAKAIEDSRVKADAASKIREQAERDAEARRKARFTINLQAIKQRVSAETDAVTGAQDILEARRAAGLVSEADYYSERRRLLDANAAIQVRGLQDENRRLDAETKRVTDAAATARAAADAMVGKGDPKYAQALDDAGRKTSEAQATQIQNAAQIKENLAEEARLTSAVGVQTGVLTIQEQARFEALERGYKQSRASAQSYLDTILQQQERTLAGQGAGKQQRDFDSGRNQVDDRYAQQRQELEQARIRGDFANKQAEYDRQLALINEFHRKALEAYGNYWDRLKAGEQDWTKGASEAVINYMDEVANTAKSTEGLVGNFLQGAEDAWVRFVRTGKLSIRDLVNTTITELTRLATQKFFAQILGSFRGGATGGGGPRIGGATAPILNARGNVFTSPSLSAYSGRVVSNPTAFAFARGAGIMGEAGPEGILPLKRSSSGQLGVIAVGGGRGSGMPTVIIHNHTPARVSSSFDNGELLLTIREEAKREVARSAPGVIASQLENPNSRVSKSMSRNTTAGRQRN